MPVLERAIVGSARFNREQRTQLPNLQWRWLLKARGAIGYALVAPLLFSTVLAANPCKVKRDKGLKPLPGPTLLVMDCVVDQYKVTFSGWHLPTYLRCKNGQRETYLYHLVPDHQVSAPLENDLTIYNFDNEGDESGNRKPR